MQNQRSGSVEGLGGFILVGCSFTARGFQGLGVPGSGSRL